MRPIHIYPAHQFPCPRLAAQIALALNADNHGLTYEVTTEGTAIRVSNPDGHDLGFV